MMSGLEIAAVSLLAGSQVAQASAQKKLFKMQARATEEEATRAREEADFQETELRHRNSQVLGRQRALFAKSGVKLEGSPLLAQSETASQGELDAMTVRRRADAGLGRALNDALLSRLQGRNALMRGAFNAGNTILSGLKQSASKFPNLG